ncbi:unnamed protein product [Adineta steineri]|uniref:G-protein coupled receptors family 1 profile domain-containing protein n=1 Tax=Adineta steineri TaxID=433720 RepID=A0A819I2I5_9BILA|nr:unnamed protein product [Adineta steineri]
MINYGNGLVGYILTIISLICASFALIVSFIVILTVIYHQYHNLLIEVNIETLIGDVYGNDFDSSLCVFKGYFMASICCTIYHAFVTQAFFRLCRIVYSNHRWLQLYWFYIIIGPIQIVIAFTLLSPLVIWHDIHYLPKEHYCYISFTNLRDALWLVFGVYSIPVSCLSIIYLRITIFIRQQTTNQRLVVRRRVDRDISAIRRIILNISILLSLGLPTVALLLMLVITGIEHPLIYRTMWIAVEVGSAILSVQMVLMTPQLKTIFINRWLRNRVVPAAHPLQIRVTTTAE